MKHAKKMMLVDIPNVQNNESYVNNDLVSRTSFAENYIKPQTAFNLDQDLRNILNRPDLDDHEKWMLYNQSHQRFLFLLDEERKKKIIKTSSATLIFSTNFHLQNRITQTKI